MRSKLKSRRLQTESIKEITMESFSEYSTLTTEGFFSKIKDIFTKTFGGGAPIKPIQQFNKNHEYEGVNLKELLIPFYSGTILNPEWLSSKNIKVGGISADITNLLTSDANRTDLLKAIVESFEKHLTNIDGYIKRIEGHLKIVEGGWSELYSIGDEYHKRNKAGEEVLAEYAEKAREALDDIQSKLDTYKLNSYFDRPKQLLECYEVSNKSGKAIAIKKPSRGTYNYLDADGLVKLTEFFIDNLDTILYLDENLHKALDGPVTVEGLDGDIYNEVYTHQLFLYCKEYDAHGWWRDYIPEHIVRERFDLTTKYVGSMMSIITDHLDTW